MGFCTNTLSKTPQCLRSCEEGEGQEIERHSPRSRPRAIVPHPFRSQDIGRSQISFTNHNVSKLQYSGTKQPRVSNAVFCLGLSVPEYARGGGGVPECWRERHTAVAAHYRHWHEVSIPFLCPWQFRIFGPVDSRCEKLSETGPPKTQPQKPRRPPRLDLVGQLDWQTGCLFSHPVSLSAVLLRILDLTGKKGRMGRGKISLCFCFLTGCRPVSAIGPN